MNTLIIVLLSILAWQLVVAIVCFVTNENETIVMRTAIGFWLLPIALVDIVYKCVSLMVGRRYNLYQFFGVVEGQSTYLNGWCHNFYMTPKTASKFARLYGKDEDIKENYSIRLLREGKEFKSAPYKQEILTDQKLEQGFSGYSADWLKKFLDRA